MFFRMRSFESARATARTAFYNVTNKTIVALGCCWPEFGENAGLVVCERSRNRRSIGGKSRQFRQGLSKFCFRHTRTDGHSKEVDCIVLLSRSMQPTSQRAKSKGFAGPKETGLPFREESDESFHCKTSRYRTKWLYLESESRAALLYIADCC